MILYYLEYVCNIYNIGFVITIERLPCSLVRAKISSAKSSKNGPTIHILCYLIENQMISL